MKNKVIQFGEGGFLRGFVDWMLQCVNETTDFDGSVVVVQPIERGMCEMLEAQNCNYNLIMRGMRDGKACVEAKYIDVIDRCVNPYTNYDSYLALAENPDFRFVVSNTTEAGISYTEGDTLEARPQVSFPAKVCALLWKRYQCKLPGFVFIPCELIEANGSTLKSIVLRYADEWGLGKDFAAWVENENIFCNTLVDRIVTGYPRDEKIEGYENDKMLDTCELFHLWVIEGYTKLFEELPFDKAGLNVILTDDITPYRTRKVRILNGAHTSLIPYALLSNVETVRDCMQNETLSAHLKACVFDEIIPTLDLSEEELVSYANSVLERFDNPYIRHYCSSIALNSVSKFKVRVLPSILEYVNKKNAYPEHLIFAFAKLIDFYRTDMVQDSPDVAAFMKTATVEEILANTALWDADLSFLAAEVKKYANS